MDKKAIIHFFNIIQPAANFKRAGKLFHTRNTSYFYDTGTGKVFACEDLEYNLLQMLLTSSQPLLELEHYLDDSNYMEAAHTIISLIESEHILQVPVYTSFTDQKHNDGKLKQLTLEVTQRCNLRCHYCIYDEGYEQFRSFTQADMTWETAKAALDFANTYGADDLIVSFYGGEPFLNADLVKKSIAYTLEHLAESRYIVFTLTSNLTMLDEELASYLASIPNMQVVCSLDGPQDIQDAYRVFPNQTAAMNKPYEGCAI